MTKKYHCIAKVGNEKFVKYNVNNLMSFCRFLDDKFNDWRYFNVFSKATKKQVGNFTKNNRPANKTL